MINRSENSPRLEQVYREYVQFINDSYIVSPLSILFMALSHVVILTDLLVKLAPNNSFVQNITYLGVSPMLLQVALSDQNIAFCINIIIIVILISPVYSVLTIIYQGYWCTHFGNGTFKQKFQKSWIHNSIRSFSVTFAFIFMPVFISYGTKIISEGSPSNIFGIIILILSVINGMFIEYHILELGNDDPKSQNLVPLNFPAHLIDSALVVIALVTLNITSGQASQLIGLAFIVLRLGLTFYMPFYNNHNQRYYRLIAISSAIASLGLLISYYNIDRNYNLFLILILVVYLLFIYSKKEEVPVWEQLMLEDGDQQGLQTIKKNLCGKGLFVRSFRALIFLGRQNFSHRTLLEIEILKSKCYSLQKIHRGGSRVVGALQVIKFEERTINFMRNFLNACEMSVSILKFMQSKEGRQQILAKAIQELISLLEQNQIILKQLFNLNEYSPEVKFLLIKTYGLLYNDANFLKETHKWMSEALQMDNQKQLKEKLFHDKAVAIFINILEELGKVVKISKNLPTVLGYEPANLLGLSINEIIPFSVKAYHDENLLEFIERYSNSEAKKNSTLNFYAYNSEFHLQEVIVRYSWVMNDFSSFYMAGIVERIDSNAHVILTDQYGNLEGWTKKIGGQELNLDSISITERQKYNIMPLFPTLIKYMDSLGVVVRTIFFKTSKVRDGNLVVIDSDTKENLETAKHKMLKAFKSIIKDEQIVAVYYAQIEFVRVSLCQGRANLRKITIKDYDSIENLSEVLGLIEKMSTNSGIKTDRSLVSCSDMVGADTSEKQQYSYFSEDNKIDRKIDSNFGLNPEGDNYFAYQQLVFGEFNISKTALEITAVYEDSTRRKKFQVEDKTSNSHDTSFSPTLQKHSTLFVWVFLVTVVFVILFVFNVIQVVNAGQMFAQESKQVVDRNKAASIYLKSIFNPNATYVDLFINGSLIDNVDYLYSLYFNYTTFLGDTLTLNQYYLFNTQVPSTLQRLVNPPLLYSNITVDIIPPTNADYYQEITKNYIGVVQQYHAKFTGSLNVWKNKVDSIQFGFFIRFAFLCVGAVVYSFLLMLMYYRQRRHKQTLEAFFKFEKEDLEKKIVAIGGLVRELEGQAAEINLLKQFGQIVKKDQISNVQFGLIKNLYEVKIRFAHDSETENNLEKKKYYFAVGVLIIFVIAQIIFLVVHSVINLQALSFYRDTPVEIDKASKLIVEPNYLLADIFQALPQDILLVYEQYISLALGAPSSSIPELYTYLGSVPCPSCNFMYPVLTTNYKSFYSTFQQRAVQIKNSGTINKTQIADLMYAADYVIEQVTPVLLTSSYQYVQSSISVYIISMIILCIAIYVGSKGINTQIQKLETFLLFFTEETITKNKHMNRLFTNFQ